MTDLDLDIEYLIAKFQDEFALVEFLNTPGVFPEYDDVTIESMIVTWFLVNGWIEVEDVN